jgi:PAS domain-containing protein
MVGLSRRPPVTSGSGSPESVGPVAHSGEGRWWGEVWATALGAASFAVKDEHRRFVHVSAGFAERLGTTVRAMTGMSERDLGLPDADAGRVEAEEEAAIATGAPVPVSVRYRQDDRRTRYVSGVRFPVAGPAGQTGVGCLFLDVSDHVAAKKRFELFVNQSTVLATIKDLDQRFVWVSEAVAARYQMPLHDIIGRTPGELFGPEFGAENQAQDEAMLAAGGAPTPVDFEWPLDPANPTQLRGNRFAFTDENGHQLIGTLFVDVTEEREARLKAQEAARRAGRRGALRRVHAPLTRRGRHERRRRPLPVGQPRLPPHVPGRPGDVPG